MVIEVGANVGIFTCFFGQKLLNKGGVVFSFEPSQAAIKRLVYNIEINRLYNVSVFSCGITERFGLYDFYEPEGHLSNGSIVSSFAQSFSDKVVRNKAIFLDGNLINGLIENRRPSKVLIKIDAEGHDCVVMRSLIPIISAYKPDIIIEVLPDNRDEIFQTFQQVCQGYKFFGFDYGGLKIADSFRPLVGRDIFLSFSG